MIPRTQRTCFSCIYGGKLIDQNDGMVDRVMFPPEYYIECRRNALCGVRNPDDFCGEGQWEWVKEEWFADQILPIPMITVVHYSDNPFPGLTEVW